MTRKTNVFKSKRFAKITRRGSVILAVAIAMSCVEASTISAKNENPIKAAIATTQLSFPLPEFPADGKTYFNVSGTSACASHVGCDYDGGCSCLSYAGSIQCDGFAKYASDRYAHRSSWAEVAGDTNKKSVDISTPENAKKEIQELSVGAYVRVDNFHSFVIAAITDTGLSIYEANNGGGRCIVSERTITYAQLAKDYSTITRSMSHHFDNYISANQTYHRIQCSSSGCNGYILESHSFTGGYGRYDAGYHKKLCSASGCYALEVHNFQQVNSKFVCKQCKYATTSPIGVASTEEDR